MKYFYNDKFFETMTDRSAYYLGFIFADGNIQYKPEKGIFMLQININCDDKEILESFKRDIDSTKPIYTYDKVSSFEGKPEVVFHLYGKKLISDLMSYGVIPRKTFRITIPQIDCMNAFIRGYFDGDGCVNIYHQKKSSDSMRTTMVSSCRSFLEDIGTHLRSCIGLIPKIYRTSIGDAWRLQYGARESIALYDYMYNPGTVYLKRKKDKFEDWLKYKGLMNEYKAKCCKCGNQFVRTRKEKNVCNVCHKIRRSLRHSLATQKCDGTPISNEAQVKLLPDYLSNFII